VLGPYVVKIGGDAICTPDFNEPTPNRTFSNSLSLYKVCSYGNNPSTT